MVGLLFTKDESYLLTSTSTETFRVYDMKRERVAYSIRFDKGPYDSDTLYKMVLGNKENTVMVFQTSGICKIIN